MTDNEIIKALECCEVEFDCTDCPKFTEQGCNGIASEVLDLIKRQQAEIKKLHKEVEGYKAELESEHLSRMDNIRELQAEIEDLKQSVCKWKNHAREMYDSAKALREGTK